MKAKEKTNRKGPARLAQFKSCFKIRRSFLLFSPFGFLLIPARVIGLTLTASTRAGLSTSKWQESGEFSKKNWTLFLGGSLSDV